MISWGKAETLAVPAVFSKRGRAAGELGIGYATLERLLDNEGLQERFGWP